METFRRRGSGAPARRLHRSRRALTKTPASTYLRRQPQGGPKPGTRRPTLGRCPETAGGIPGAGRLPRPLAVLVAAAADAAPLNPGRPALRRRLRGGPGSRPGPRLSPPSPALRGPARPGQPRRGAEAARGARPAPAPLGPGPQLPRPGAGAPAAPWPPRPGPGPPGHAASAPPAPPAHPRR